MARQWQTVLVSVVAHVVGVFLIVVVPLLAFDGLPAIRSATEYVPVEMKIPELPPAPRLSTPAPTTMEVTSGPPTVAPDKIGPEIERQPPSIAIPGTVGGFDPSMKTGAPLQDFKIDLPPPQKLSAPIRPGGQVKPPDRLTYSRPEYPAIAISARVSGSVIIEAIIGTDGLVRDAKVLRSIPLLDEAALKAVRQWRYTPTLLNGMPVAVIMTVTVTFTLDRLNF